MKAIDSLWFNTMQGSFGFVVGENEMGERKLERMGLKLKGDFTLKSGAKNNVKWDIEKMFQYPQWVRIETLRPWIWEIGLYRPNNLIGIRSGGFLLACDVGKALDAYITDKYTTTVGHNRRAIVVDDVITTGRTIRGYLSEETIAIAVLVNRSGLDEINGIPIVTGIFADAV